MPVIKDIGALKVPVQDAVRKALSTLEKGTYFISETLRTKETQVIYYCNGRASADLCDLLYKEFDLPRSPKDQIITWTLKSRHFDGLAIDVYPMKGTKILWNYADDPIAWTTVISAFRNVGFICGADWKEKDYPHFEWKE